MPVGKFTPLKISTNGEFNPVAAVSVGVGVTGLAADDVATDKDIEHCHAIVQPVVLVSGLQVPAHGVAGCGATGHKGCEDEPDPTNAPFSLPEELPTLSLHDERIAARVCGPTTP